MSANQETTILQILLRIVAVTVLAPIVLGTFAIAAEPSQSHSFKFTIESHVDMVIEGEKQKIDADTELHYTWNHQGGERNLSFDSMLVKVNKDDIQTMNIFMSREKFENMERGQTDVVPFEEAPDELKKILQDSFGVPVYKMQVDGNGKELKREVVAGPGAKDIIEQGVIANARLFHAPFMRAQDKWSAATEITMGNGGFANGELTYKKAAGGKGGQAVKVSGTLTNEGFKVAGTPVSIKEAKYVIDGMQTYDPAQREWISGNLDVDVFFVMTAGNKPLATAKGTMVFSVDKLQTKK